MDRQNIWVTTEEQNLINPKSGICRSEIPFFGKPEHAFRSKTEVEVKWGIHVQP